MPTLQDLHARLEEIFRTLEKPGLNSDEKDALAKEGLKIASQLDSPNAKDHLEKHLKKGTADIKTRSDLKS